MDYCCVILRLRLMAALLCAIALGACGSSDGGKGPPNDGNPPVSSDGPLTATLSATASDADGDPLTYTWHVSAGVLSSKTGSSVKWTVPSGGGLNFAYLTVSDGRGGYVERQYVLELGDPTGPPAVANPRSAMFDVTPRDGAASAPGGTFRGTFSILRNFGADKTPRRIYLPDQSISARKTRQSSESDVAFSNLFGEATLPRLASGDWAMICNDALEVDLLRTGSQQYRDEVIQQECRGNAFNALTALKVQDASIWEKAIAPALEASYRLYGHVALQDGHPCGLVNLFKSIEVGAKVQLVDGSGFPVVTTRVNAFGDYALSPPDGPLPGGYRLRFQCEALTSDLTLPDGLFAANDDAVEFSTTLPNRLPVVSEISATANQQPVGQPLVDDSNAPSSMYPRADHFLTYKGTDSASSACAYYKAVGATPSCGQGGALPDDAIQFDEWKRIRKLAPYNGSTPEGRAIYVNRVDLNLVRDMHAVKNGPGDFAFYVCNHPGPDSTSAADIEKAIASAVAGKGLVACVAMDYSITPGSNNDLPFTKFYVFGPDGRLRLSVNLDKRGEKFIPGSCVICHGGSGYAGQFPRHTWPLQLESNGPTAAVDAKFLPFDLANYLFSGESGLLKDDQQVMLKQLNLLVRDIDSVGHAPGPISTLIEGWYAGSVDPSIASRQDESFVPPFWQDANDPSRAEFYGTVIARACRTCHVALPNADWNLSAPSGLPYVCGGSADLQNNGIMASSKVTFDILWSAARQPGAAGAGYREMMRHYLGCDASGKGIFAPFPDPVYPSQ